MPDEGFEVAYMKEAEDFLNGLTKKVRDKIFFNITKVMNGVKDKELFKKLDGSDDIWEFRTKYDGMEYRLLAFWDKDTQRLVIATHGMVKKTWKIPTKEIDRAEALRKKYYRIFAASKQKNQNTN